MDLNYPDLVGLEYPGRVENVDNMLKTLGGVNNISKVVIIRISQILLKTLSIKGALV